MSRATANPWIGITFISDNPRMETPPAYFLARLHDYDADLVILPSRQRPFAYVIARRQRFSAGLSDAAIKSTAQQDTLMCLRYGLVPVCLMFKTGSTWDVDAVLRSLMARDLWAHGGGDKVADMLEAQEEAEQQAVRKQIREDMWHRSGDAWRSYKFRTGQAVGMALGAQSGRRIPKQAPSGSTAGSGSSALFSHDR